MKPRLRAARRGIEKLNPSDGVPCRTCDEPAVVGLVTERQGEDAKLHGFCRECARALAVTAIIKAGPPKSCSPQPAASAA